MNRQFRSNLAYREIKFTAYILRRQPFHAVAPIQLSFINLEKAKFLEEINNWIFPTVAIQEIQKLN